MSKLYKTGYDREFMASQVLSITYDSKMRGKLECDNQEKNFKMAAINKFVSTLQRKRRIDLLQL